MDPAAQQSWMEQWRGAAEALAAQRRDELRSLSPAKALAAAEAVLSLADPGAISDARRLHSGLVEQQRLLRLLPR